MPTYFNALLHIPIARRIFFKKAVPKGIYEYIIARTKYIDRIFEQALAQQMDQILIFGAGFDSRAIRFQDIIGDVKVFELDVSTTQQAKIRQYKKRHLAIPSNLRFISINFDRDSLPQKLKEAGFYNQKRSLFILEGLLMYLQSDSVFETFKTIRDFAGTGSYIVFDYIYTSVLRGEDNYYGEAGILKKVTDMGERWNFGIEKGQIEPFLAKYTFRLIDHKDAADLEKEYFSSPDGRIIGKVNGTHCLVTAKKL